MKAVISLLLLFSFGQAFAGEALRDPQAVEVLLKGATLQGVYLRTGSAYTLEFREDGQLVDGRGAAARWWVNDQGQYCREWLSGQLAGNRACMDIRQEGRHIQLYSAGKRVAEGELLR